MKFSLFFRKRSRGPAAGRFNFQQSRCSGRPRWFRWVVLGSGAVLVSPVQAGLPAVSGGNISVIQAGAGNTESDVIVSVDSKVNSFNKGGSNKGDCDVYVTPYAGYHLAEGVFIPSVRQNGRDNGAAPNSGGNPAGSATGKAFATVVLVNRVNFMASLSTYYVQSPAGGSAVETNVDLAALYFPYGTAGNPGWISGQAENASNGGPMTAANSRFSPGINVGTQFVNLGGGQYTLNLSGVPGAPAQPSQNGVLLVTGGRDEANFGLGQANADIDGTFRLFIRDNGASGAGNYENDGVAFAYIAANTPGVVAGRVLGNGTAVAGVSSGVFSTTTAAVLPGQVLLQVPGVTGPNDAVLVATMEGGATLNQNNIVNYEWSSALGGYVVESRTMSGSGFVVPALENVGTEPMFSFCLVRTVPEFQVAQPSAEARTTGGQLDYGTVVQPGSLAKTYTITNNRVASLAISSVTVSGGNAGDFTVNTAGMAATLAPGASTTFSVSFAPAAAGSRSTTLQVLTSSADLPDYTLTLTGSGAATALTGQQVIYADDFSGAPGTNLHSVVPDAASGNYGGSSTATWNSHADWKANGSRTSAVNGGSFLPFRPESGHRYTLSMDVDVTSATLDTIGMGFTPSAAPFLTNQFDRAAGPTTTTAWMERRGTATAADPFPTFTGPGPAGRVNYQPSPPVSGPVNMTVVLDTRGALWTAEYFVGHQSIRGPVVLGENNQDIRSVGFGTFLIASSTITGVVDNFRLSVSSDAAPVLAVAGSADEDTAQTITINGGTSVPAGTTYTINFGDGTAPLVLTAGTALPQVLSHTWAQPGTYSVTVTASGPGGTYVAGNSSIFINSTTLAEDCSGLIAYEPFDYPADNSLLEAATNAAGQGWTNAAWVKGGSGVRNVRTTGLTYPGLQSSAGMTRVATAVAVQHSRTLLVAAPAEAVTRYMSYLVRRDSAASHYAGVEIIGGGGSSLFAGYPGSSSFFVLENSGGASRVASTVPHQLSTTHLVVVKYEALAGIDRFSLYIDPVPGASEPAAADALKTDLDVGTVTALRLTTNGVHALDELRWGETWESVTPKIARLPTIGVPVLAESFTQHPHGPDSPANGHLGGSGPWTTPWGNRPVVSAAANAQIGYYWLGLRKNATAAGDVVYRSFAPALPDSGEAWISFSMQASGVDNYAFPATSSTWGGLALFRGAAQQVFAGMSSDNEVSTPARLGKELWRLSEASRVDNASLSFPVRLAGHSGTDITTTVRRTAVLKLELAPGNGGIARMWLGADAGRVDINREPDAVLTGCSLSGLDTIRLGGRAWLDIRHLRMGPTPADVETLIPMGAAPAYTVADDFSGTPGHLCGQDTGTGWTAPWGNTPAHQSSGPPHAAHINATGSAQPENSSIVSYSYRSLPAPTTENHSLYMQFDAEMPGATDRMSISLHHGTGGVGVTRFNNTPGYTTWTLADQRANLWGDAGMAGPDPITVVTSKAPLVRHTLGLKLDIGAGGLGTVRLWVRNDVGPIDTSLPPDATLTGADLRGLDAFRAYLSGATNRLDNLLISSAPEIGIEQPVNVPLDGGSSTIAYGPVDLDATVVKTFTIRNAGAFPLNISTVSVAGDEFADYTVDTSGMISTVAAGGTTTFSVTFAPAAGGDRNTVLSVFSDDADEAIFDIALTGTGVPVMPEISLTGAAVLTVNEGSGTTNAGTFSDPQGNATVTVSASLGSVTQDNGAGAWNWSYTPPDGPDGPVTVTITATDDSLVPRTATTTFTLTVNNVAPAAVPQTGAGAVTVLEDSGVTIITLAATDPGADALTYTIVTPPGAVTGSLGSVIGNQVNFSPAANYHGTTSFTFRATDSDGADSNVATVEITVTPVNDAPFAAAQSVTTNEDTAVAITLAAVDVDLDALSYTVIAAPLHGTLSGLAPNLTYTPAVDFNGADSFTFKTNDGAADSNIATVSITVTAVNDAPVAAAQSVTTDEDTAAVITLTGSDVDLDALTYSVVINPLHGTLSGTAPNLTYTPAAHFNGADSFTFKANDGAADSNIATVSITVTAVNDAPVAAAQSVTTDEDTAAVITLTGSDVDLDALTYSVVINPLHGTLSGTAPNLTYTPAADFNGADSFTFQTNDGAADSNIATVSITVTPVNDTPAGSIPDQAVVIGTPLTLNIAPFFTDADADTLTFTLVTNSNAAAASASLTGSSLLLTGLAAGTTIITVSAADGNGGSVLDEFMVTVANMGSAPVASPATYTRAVATSLKIDIASLLADSTSDPDGDTRTLQSVGASAQGASVTVAGPWILYNPANDHDDTFSYTISDGHGHTATGIITVSVVTLAGRIVNFTLNDLGQPVMQFAGIPGYRYTIERSPDLAGWTPLHVLDAPPTGVFSFTDTSPPTGSAFYRMTYTPPAP